MATNEDSVIEDATAGKSHNVIQEAVGTGIGAVLVINLGIDVTTVGGGDDAGCWLVVLLSPAADLDILRHARRRKLRSIGASQMQGEEESAIALKS